MSDPNSRNRSYYDGLIEYGWGTVIGITEDWWYFDNPAVIYGENKSLFFGMLEFSIGVEK